MFAVPCLQEYHPVQHKRLLEHLVTLLAWKFLSLERLEQLYCLDKASGVSNCLGRGLGCVQLSG